MDAQIPKNYYMKEINEKTFELNITSQLLNTSKSFIYYMTKPFISSIMNEEQWFEFLQENIFFSKGLTQKQEADPVSGGYDVCINYRNKQGRTGRLLFLQYKSGVRADYCTNPASQFHGSRSNKKPHVVFTFNDAADQTQHSTLRALANSAAIKPASVLYVFPRITEESEFFENCDDLLCHTSFVPVLEIDRQGMAQKPPVVILDGVSHRYRTSYDGNTAEVNYYYYYFYYEQLMISSLISELICIEFERLLNAAAADKKLFVPALVPFVNNVLDKIESHKHERFRGIDIPVDTIAAYLQEVTVKGLNSEDVSIPKAPEHYTTEITDSGMTIKWEGEQDLSNIQFQII